MMWIAVVLLAPLLHGIMKKCRALLQGRRGPTIVQPYRDFAKLWKKEALLADGAQIAGCVPGIVLGVALTFAVLVTHNGPLDIVGVALLLAAGRFALTLAALETRSPFAGMAASREMTFSALTEPTLLLALFAAVSSAREPAAQAPAFAALFLMTLAETARIPVDNQETHYELTMIHEGLLLEFSGWHLALLQAAAQIRQACYILLLVSVLPGTPWRHAFDIVAIAGAITLVETFFARLRLFEVPQLLATAFIFAGCSVVVRFLGVSF